MRINLRIAYFSHFSILRKKNVKTGIFVPRFRIPLRIAFVPSRWHRSVHNTHTWTCVSPFLFPALSVAPARSSPFFRKREWDKLVNLYANGFGLGDDRGVTAVSAPSGKIELREEGVGAAEGKVQR